MAIKATDIGKRRIAIVGTDQVLRNLNNKIQDIRGRTKAGLREAALLVKRRAQQLTPVKTSNLKGSAYTSVFSTLYGPTAEIGYTASYAPFVHEIPPPPAKSPGGRSATHRVGQWKFLETAISQSTKDILDIIARRAKV